METITELYVVVSDQPDGGEGICAAFVEGAWIPMVASNNVKLVQMLTAAQRMADETQKPFRVLKFSTREVVREVVPK